MSESRQQAAVQVSILVPCRDERACIAQCLRSILQSDFPKEQYEVIVADGASSDGTRAIVQKIASQTNRITLVDNPEATVPSALNRMLAVAQGKFIIRFDAHSEMPGDYIRKCLAVLNSTGAWNVGGHCVSVPRDESTMARAIAALTSHWFGVGRSRFRTGGRTGPANTVVFGAFPRWVFDRIGGFNERLVRNQDYEFNRRIRKHGGTVYYSDDIFAYYHNQGSLTGLLRQACNTGMWNVEMIRIAPYAFAFRHVVPAGFILAIAMAVACAATAAVSGLALPLAGAVPALLYCVLWSIASCELLMKRRPAAGLAALIFPLYHGAYGLGVLRGLSRAAFRAAGRLLQTPAPASAK